MQKSQEKSNHLIGLTEKVLFINKFYCWFEYFSKNIENSQVEIVEK